MTFYQKLHNLLSEMHSDDLSTLKKVVDSTDAAGLEAYLEHNELPPIKMSSIELEAAMGGVKDNWSRFIRRYRRRRSAGA